MLTRILSVEGGVLTRVLTWCLPVRSSWALTMSHGWRISGTLACNLEPGYIDLLKSGKTVPLSISDEYQRYFQSCLLPHLGTSPIASFIVP